MLRRDGEISGFLANVPGLMLLDGKPAVVFSVSTWMVLPEDRERSLELFSRQMESARSTLLFDTTPTAPVAEILSNLGFELLPWGAQRESILLLRAGECLLARLPALSHLPQTAAALAAKTLDALQSWRLEGLRPRPGLRTEERREAGRVFDGLWERTRALYSTTNVRDAETLHWHCFSDHRVEKRLFACFSADDATGYMILKGKRRAGLRVLECVDFWEDPAVDGTLETLLCDVRQRAAAEGYHLLSFGHFSPRLGGRLRQIGLADVALSSRSNYCLVGSSCRTRPRVETSYFVGLQGDYGTSP